MGGTKQPSVEEFGYMIVVPRAPALPFLEAWHLSRGRRLISAWFPDPGEDNDGGAYVVSLRVGNELKPHMREKRSKHRRARESTLRRGTSSMSRRHSLPRDALLSL